MNADVRYTEEEYEGQTYDLRILWRLARYLRPYGRYLVVSLVLLIIITGVELVLPYLIKVAIDDYILFSSRRVTISSTDPFARTFRDQNRGLLTATQDANTFFINEKDIDRLNPALLHMIKQKGLMAEERYYPAPLTNSAVQVLLERKSEDISRSEETAFIPYKQLQDLPNAQLVQIRERDLRGVLWIGIIFIIVLVIEFITSYGQVYYLQYIGQWVMHDLRMELCDHLQSLSVQFFERNPVGKLVTRATNDIQNLEEMFTSIFVQFLKDFMVLLGIMVVMLILNWKLALLLFLLLPVVAVMTVSFGIRVRDAFRDVRKLIAQINAFIQENFSGITVVKIFNRIQENSRRFEKLNEENYLANIRQNVIFSVFRPLVEIVLAVGTALLIWQGGGQVISQTLSLGVLVAFLSYIQKMFEPVRYLSERYGIMQSAMASSERIFSLLDEDDRIPEPKAPKLLPSAHGNISFDNVVFSYNSGDPVLKGVSFDIHEGETVAVVGPTGAGKSTLIKLLVRFYDVQQGRILFDGVDIRLLDKQFIRSQIGLVQQDSFLFADTVAYNIRLGNSAITQTELEYVARLVNADRFISRLEDKFNHIITEDGATLSTGERQLLCFARALAANPRVLVLDEATSNIDPETERLIQEALINLTRQRTAFIVAHRLSTIKRADRILVLHKGIIREQGTHDDLMAKEGIYYKLYQLQYQ